VAGDKIAQVEEEEGKPDVKAGVEEPVKDPEASGAGGNAPTDKPSPQEKEGKETVKKKKAKPAKKGKDDGGVPNEPEAPKPADDGKKVVASKKDEAEPKDKVVKGPKDAGAKHDSRDAGEPESFWKPRTQLGLRVFNGELKTMEDVMKQPSPIKEVELVDKLLPELSEEILDVERVQRVTDSGRRMRFRVVAAVGNGNGYVGVGQSKGKEAGPTIRKSIERAKLHITGVKRGCGSWECGCGGPHTVPFKVTGKAGSVTVTLKPAPRGVGIVSGEIAKTILSLAGIKDVWVTTQGHSRTGINFAHAVIKALQMTNYVKLRGGDEEKLHMVSGQVGKPEQAADELEVTA
jgi:small subunit ribosomal protein S5